MLPTEKLSQYGFERELSDVNCLVIHNTSSTLSAKELYDYLENESKDTRGCHYLVDYKEVIQVAPHNWGIYNCGKGEDYSSKHSIAIEVCSNNDDELYFEGEEKAKELIKSLMEEFNIPKSEIYFHKDFSPTTYCPADILRIYGTKKNFINTFIN